MAQMILKNNGQINVTEERGRVFELLQDVKQFIVVHVEHIVSVDYDQPNETKRIHIVKTAINKSEIEKAF